MTVFRWRCRRLLCQAFGLMSLVNESPPTCHVFADASPLAITPSGEMELLMAFLYNEGLSRSAEGRVGHRI